jgi:hypothetical protein
MAPNPRERYRSPTEDGVLVAGAGRPAAAASTDETEHRMVVRKRAIPPVWRRRRGTEWR